MLSIYNYDNTKLAILKSNKTNNNIQGEAFNIENTIEINGTKTLSFKIPYYIYIDGVEEENYRIQFLIPEILIKFTNNNIDDFYIVNKINESHSDGKVFLDVECYHISIILNKKGLKKVFVDNIEDYTNVTDIYDGLGTAQQLLTRILSGTGWTVGTVDTFYEKDGTTEKLRTLTCDKISTMEQLDKFAELFNGFPQFNGDNTIDFNLEIGVDRGVTFRYRYNIKSIEKTLEDTDLITRLYVEGAETDDGIVSITEYTENGEPYHDNFQYYINSGLMPQSIQDKITLYNQDIKTINDSINGDISNVDTDTTAKHVLEGQRDGKVSIKQSLETLIQDLTAKIASAIGTEKTNLQNTKTTKESELATINSEISALNNQIANYDTNITNYNTSIDGLVNQRITLRQQFENDTQNFLKIGLFSDSSYYDGQKLFDDTTDTLDEMSMPKVSYSMDIVDLAELPDYELMKFDIGDIINIVDERLKLKTKGRITKIAKDFANPLNTKIEIANFYSPFEELFRDLTSAVNTVKFEQQKWNRSGKALDSNGNINQQMLQKAFSNNAYQLLSGTNNSVTWDRNGITITDLNNPNNILRMNAGIITLSNDGGISWRVGMDANGFNFSEALGGVLEIGKIFITGGPNNSTFNWTENGLLAYNPSNENQWIKFDKNGIVGTLDGGTTYEFSLTFAGLKIGKHAVEGLEDELSQITQDISTVQENLNTFVNTTYTNDIDNLQSQIDGNITSWFYDGVPTLINNPAINWTTNEIKDTHLGDLYYDNLTGYAYRFRFTTVYEWFRITDTDITKALADAVQAQDTADSKRRVFTTTPTTPYDIGDLWTQGTSGDLMRCKISKLQGQSYSSSDWEKASKYTDDTVANQAQEIANISYSELSNQFFEKSKMLWSTYYEGKIVTENMSGAIVAGVGSNGGNVLELAGSMFAYWSNPIPIDVNRVYKGRFKVRQTVNATSGNSYIYAGVATLDANYNNITGGAGTHRYFIVSSHALTTAEGWQTYEATITGVGDLANNFRAGTAYVRPMFIVNHSNGNGTAQVDCLEFFDITESYNAQQTANNSVQKGTAYNNVSITPERGIVATQDGGLSETILDGDGFKRKIISSGQEYVYLNLFESGTADLTGGTSGVNNIPSDTTLDTQGYGIAWITLTNPDFIGREFKVTPSFRGAVPLNFLTGDGNTTSVYINVDVIDYDYINARFKIRARVKTVTPANFNDYWYVNACNISYTAFATS